MRDRGGSLSAASVRTLTLLATGDQSQADRAYSERVLEELEQKRARG